LPGRSSAAGSAPFVNTRHEFHGLFSLYEAILLFWAGLIVLAVVFALIRYTRRRPDQASRREKAHVVEALYALVIAGFVAVLSVNTFRAEDRVDRVSGRPAVTIHVTGFQWGWRFAYSGGGSVAGDQNDPPSATVPVGATVLFEGTSRDVIHSFYLPDLRFKADVNPGQTHRWELAFPHTGVYEGECAEFCGLNHTGMSFRFVAVSRERFASWLAAHGGTG
jgi:cytochrome c oxidase subunit 2